MAASELRAQHSQYDSWTKRLEKRCSAHCNSLNQSSGVDDKPGVISVNVCSNQQLYQTIAYGQTSSLLKMQKHWIGIDIQNSVLTFWCDTHLNLSLIHI